MNSFWGNIGLLAITFLIGYGYKKILEYYHFKYSGFYENETVYKAADEFAHGATPDNVKAILTNCFDFDEEDAENILAESLPHRLDNDGGYHAFIKSVNKVFGVELYSESYHTHAFNVIHNGK